MPTPLTDHKAVSLQVFFNTNAAKTCRSCYWKLNNSLLKHEKVIEDILSLIKHFWDKALTSHLYCQNWELFKFEAAKYLREYGSSAAKQRKNEEINVITGISALTQIPPENLSEEDKTDLASQQSKLNDIYKLKAEGAFVRSRRRWLEGEQHSSYFFK